MPLALQAEEEEEALRKVAEEALQRVVEEAVLQKAAVEEELLSPWNQHL